MGVNDGFQTMQDISFADMAGNLAIRRAAHALSWGIDPNSPAIQPAPLRQIVNVQQPSSQQSAPAAPATPASSGLLKGALIGALGLTGLIGTGGLGAFLGASLLNPKPAAPVVAPMLPPAPAPADPVNYDSNVTMEVVPPGK